MKLPVILAFVWLVFKVVMLQLGMNEDKYGVMLNLFLIVLIIFISVKNAAGERSFINLVKAALRPAALYVVCACIAIFIYYQFLDPGYLSGALERLVTDEQNKIEAVGGFAEFKAANEGVESNSLNEHLQVVRESFGGFISLFSPYGRASIALLTLTFFAVFYSLFMVAIHMAALRFIKK